MHIQHKKWIRVTATFAKPSTIKWRWHSTSKTKRSKNL